MPNLTHSAATQFARNAGLFAALGDETRLSMLRQLGEGGLCSITQLSEGRPLTRQAIRKHLSILEEAGLVRGERCGREHQFQIELKTLESVGQSLQAIAHQWGEALQRLKEFVEG